MKRSEAREKVFKIIFQIEFHEDFTQQYPLWAKEEGLSGSQGEYALATIQGILDHLKEIDNTIEQNLSGWTMPRLPKTVLAILRLGVYEINYNEDIPNVSAIDEAVKLAHIYCDDKDSVFINGLLNNVYKKEQ